MAFFGVFLDDVPTSPFFNAHIFEYMEGVEMYHLCAKFHVCLICSSGVVKFQMFSNKQKVWF